MSIIIPSNNCLNVAEIIYKKINSLSFVAILTFVVVGCDVYFGGHHIKTLLFDTLVLVSPPKYDLFLLKEKYNYLFLFYSKLLGAAEWWKCIGLVKH